MPNQPKTPGHTIRVPDDEWIPARDKAAKEGETMTDVIRRALRRYVVGALTVALTLVATGCASKAADSVVHVSKPTPVVQAAQVTPTPVVVAASRKPVPVVVAPTRKRVAVVVHHKAAATRTPVRRPKPVPAPRPVHVKPAPVATVAPLDPFTEWMKHPTFTCEAGKAPGWLNEQGIPTGCVTP